MKKIIISALMCLGVSAAVASQSPLMYCPEGSQLVAALNDADLNPYITSNMTAMIDKAAPGSINFKEALLESGAMKCVYSTSKGAAIVFVNPLLGTAQFAQPQNGQSSSGTGWSACSDASGAANSCPFTLTEQ